MYERQEKQFVNIQNVNDHFITRLVKFWVFSEIAENWLPVKLPRVACAVGNLRKLHVGH